MQPPSRRPSVTTTSAEDALRLALVSAENAAGGWGYYAGKASRLEPTAWALLALKGAAGAPGPHAAFLERIQQSSGWLLEDPRWPVNIGFNALVLTTWFALPDLAADRSRQALLGALLASKGIQTGASEGSGQDNSLQGWSWIDGTFSWVEPTSWGLLALKKARRAGVTSAAADARINEAERLLINRTCRTGGWNFGNASVMNQDLRVYMPTTALALLALQDRRDDPAVTRSIDFLEAHWADEVSAPSLGLSLICLDAYGRATEPIAMRLRDEAGPAQSFGNFHGDAVALCALASHGAANVFKL